MIHGAGHTEITAATTAIMQVCCIKELCRIEQNFLPIGIYKSIISVNTTDLSFLCIFAVATHCLHFEPSLHPFCYHQF